MAEPTSENDKLRHRSGLIKACGIHFRMPQGVRGTTPRPCQGGATPSRGPSSIGASRHRASSAPLERPVQPGSWNLQVPQRPMVSILPLNHKARRLRSPCQPFAPPSADWIPPVFRHWTTTKAYAAHGPCTDAFAHGDDPGPDCPLEPHPIKGTAATRNPSLDGRRFLAIWVPENRNPALLNWGRTTEILPRFRPS